MSDYDFKTLNDKEFEIFCADLLGEVEGHRFERFKAGKDSGIDGRFFANERKEVILQCKHWSNTPLKQLVRALSTIEKPKLAKLNPHRYVLAVSSALSRADKKSIQHALAPYISETDIYGKEDLNDLLKSTVHVEQRHYKLWLHSSSVLGHMFNNAIFGRSAFSLDEIIQSSSRYVVTANHQSALKRLEDLGVVIVTGEPGVGKTTLADHLCLHYIAQKFSYVKIADDIGEAESVFDPDSKQIFYFDDFLGRNYLEALKGHEGSDISQFIRRISRNKNKRFILTSRSTILNQGKFLIDSFEHNNLKRNEYELRIQSLSELDKAQILYNHIWHSGLRVDYIDQLYINKRYRVIISHQNFNPRLISYITDATRLETCNATDYWSYINTALTNPSQIWENPFVAQQDDFGRAIVFLVVLNGRKIEEGELTEVYHRFIGLPDNQNLKGRREFQSNIRLLTGSFLNRTFSAGYPSTIDLFNPSIGDYVLRRYASDVVMLRQGMQSLRSESSLTTLKSLMKSKFLSKVEALTIFDAVAKFLVNDNFEGTTVAYISSLCQILIDGHDGNYKTMGVMKEVVNFILTEGRSVATDESFNVIEWALEHDIVSAEQGLDFVAGNIDTINSKYEIRAVSSLLSAIPTTTLGHLNNVDELTGRAIEMVCENFDEFVDATAAFSEVEYGQYDLAREKVEKLIEEALNDLGLVIDASDFEQVCESYDVDSGLDNYFENSYDTDRGNSSGPVALDIDEVDDLFERS